MSIYFLPSELLTIIVNYLPKLETRYALSITSKFLFSNCPEICNILERDYAMLHNTFKIEKFDGNRYEGGVHRGDDWEWDKTRPRKWEEIWEKTRPRKWEEIRPMLRFGDVRVTGNRHAYYDVDSEYYRREGIPCNSQGIPRELVRHPCEKRWEVGMKKIAKNGNLEALLWLMDQKEWSMIKRVGFKNDKTKMRIKARLAYIGLSPSSSSSSFSSLLKLLEFGILKLLDFLISKILAAYSQCRVFRIVVFIFFLLFLFLFPFR